MSSINNNVRVRFAPSPTGKLHLGGLRMALYNYIFARQNKGQFLLRIEDTDQSRCTPNSAREIENTLEWASLHPNESPFKGGPYAPYIQSKRLLFYKERALELVNYGKAYKCFCSPMRLELLRRHQAKAGLLTAYDGKCRELDEFDIKERMVESKGKYVIRFASNDETNYFDDMIAGPIKFDEKKKKNTDPVILKSDFFPTYHLANVVDDHMMKISHVLRGSEWITSTAIHIQLYKAFGWNQPIFAHFPLISAKGGTKLSKRTEGSSVQSWIDLGYQPLAILNFLTNMSGGLPKKKQDDNELWDLDKIVENFNFENVTSHPGSLDVQRLDIYSKNELTKSWSDNRQEIIHRAKKILIENEISIDIDDSELERILDLNLPRLNRLHEILQPDLNFIWSKPLQSWPKSDYIEKGWKLDFVFESIKQMLEAEDFHNKDQIIHKFKNYCKQNGLNWADFMKLVRLAMTSSDKGLPVYEIFLNLGKKRSLEYLDSALEYSRSM